MIKFLLGEEWLIINYDLSPSHGLFPRVLLCHDAPHCGDSFHHLLHENKKKRKRDKKFCRYKRSSRVYFSLRFVPSFVNNDVRSMKIQQPKIRLWTKRTIAERCNMIETVSKFVWHVGDDRRITRVDRDRPQIYRTRQNRSCTRKVRLRSLRFSWNLMDTSKRNKICGNRYK